MLRGDASGERHVATGADIGSTCGYNLAGCRQRAASRSVEMPLGRHASQIELAIAGNQRQVSGDIELASGGDVAPSRQRGFAAAIHGTANRYIPRALQCQVACRCGRARQGDVTTARRTACAHGQRAAHGLHRAQPRIVAGSHGDAGTLQHSAQGSVAPRVDGCGLREGSGTRTVDVAACAQRAVALAGNGAGQGDIPPRQSGDGVGSGKLATQVGVQPCGDRQGMVGRQASRYGGASRLGHQAEIAHRVDGSGHGYIPPAVQLDG